MKKEMVFMFILFLCIPLTCTPHAWADDDAAEIDLDLTVECCCELTCFFSVANSDIGTLSKDVSRCKDVLLLPRLIDSCDSEGFEDLVCKYWASPKELAEENGLDRIDLYYEGWDGEGCATSCVAESLLDPDDPALDMLRNFRDKVLAKSNAGRAFIALYYDYAQPVMSAFRRSPHLKEHARELLEKMLPVILTSLDNPHKEICIGNELSAGIDILIEELDASVENGPGETLFTIKRNLLHCR